jgi:hypothetical protein
MDLIIYADMHVVVEILKSFGFKIELLNEHVLEAKLKDNAGRFHVLGTVLDEKKVYLDVHRDSSLHFAFLGVDYAKKPAKICREILDLAAKMGIKGEIAGGTSWFNRRNKALLRGIRI